MSYLLSFIKAFIMNGKIDLHLLKTGFCYSFASYPITPKAMSDKLESTPSKSC